VPTPAVLTVKTSSDNGDTDAYTVANLRDEAGSTVTSLTVRPGDTRRATLATQTERYLLVESTAPVSITCLDPTGELERIRPGQP
jgi:hypothetical protein